MWKANSHASTHPILLHYLIQVKKILFIQALFLVWTTLPAQTTEDCRLSLSGSVVDEHDKSSLSYATVYLIEPGKGAVADSSGLYRIQNLCKGKYTVVVRHVSCEPDTLVVQLNKNTSLNLFLEHHPEALQQITITGQTLQSSTNSDQETSVGLATLQQYSSRTLGDALAELPGVSSFKTGNSIVKPVIQGLYGTRIITVNHGVRMQDMEWGDEHSTMIDINSAGKVDLIKGGSALRYGGDAVAGLILVEPSSIPKDTLTGRTVLSGATNGWGGSITTEMVMSGKTGWYGKLQGTLKRFGDFRAPDYQLTNTGLFEKGISVMMGRQSEKGGFDGYYSLYDTDVAILAASHVGSIGDLVDAINNGEPQIVEDFSYHIGLPRQEVSHQLARFRWYGNTALGDWELQYDLQQNHRFEYDRRVGDDRDKPSIDLKLTTHSFSGNLRFNQENNLPLETGVVYRYQKNTANPETGIRRLIPDYDKYEIGAYLSGVYQAGNNLILDGGIRYDFMNIDALKFYRKSRWEERGYQDDFADIIVREYPTQLLTNPRFDYHNVAYTLGANLLVDQQTELRFNYAFTRRNPNPSELFSDGLHHGAARIELGDLRIGQESGHKLGLTFEQKKKDWNWNLGPYFKKIKDFIILEPTGVEYTIRGAFPVWEYFQRDALLWGIDGQLTANWSNDWQSSHIISYVYGQDTEENQPLINMPAPQFVNSVSFDGISWKSLKITLEGIYTFRQNRYPNNNFLVFIPETDSYEELDISTPPDAYLLLNLQAGAQFKVFNGNTLDARISINNLGNTRYRDYLNRLRYFADDLGRSFEFNLVFNY